MKKNKECNNRFLHKNLAQTLRIKKASKNGSFWYFSLEQGKIYFLIDSHQYFTPGRSLIKSQMIGLISSWNIQ